MCITILVYAVYFRTTSSNTISDLSRTLTFRVWILKVLGFEEILSQAYVTFAKYLILLQKDNATNKIKKIKLLESFWTFFMAKILSFSREFYTEHKY